MENLSQNYLKLDFQKTVELYNETHSDIVCDMADMQILCDLYTQNHFIHQGHASILEAKYSFYKFISGLCNFIDAYFHVNPQYIEDNIGTVFEKFDDIQDELVNTINALNSVIMEKSNKSECKLINTYGFAYLRHLYIIADKLNILVD